MVVNRSAAPGSVVPSLVYADVGQAIDWLCRTFGFAEDFRYGPEGSPQGARLLVGQGAVELTIARVGQSPEWGDTTEPRPPDPNVVTHSLTVPVEDVDAHYAHVVACGVRALTPPLTHMFGERRYTAQDLGGHRWSFTQSVADAAPEDWGSQPAKRR